MNDHEKDADHTFSVKNGVLTMTGGEGSIEPGIVYELTRLIYDDEDGLPIA